MRAPNTHQKPLLGKIIALAVTMLVWGAAAFSQTNWVDGTLITFNSNGAWCWYQDERAVVDVPNHKLIIASTRTSNGHNYVDMYDFSLLTLQNYDLGAIGSDDHNAPGLIIRPDGKYLAMYAQHYDAYKSRYKIFNGTSWSSTEQQFDWTTIPGGTDYTIAYSNLYYLSSENRIYNFARANNRAPNFLVSSNQGDTWTYGGQIKTNSSSTYNKGYFKYCGNGVDRIDFIFTEQHPRDFNTSIYHGYIKGGKSYRTDGTVADADIFDRTFIPTDADFTKVFAANTVVNGGAVTRCWNTDIQRYPDGTIATIITARTNSDSNNPTHCFIYCRYNGSTWSHTYLGNAGLKLYSSEQDYTGLAALHPNDPTTIFISSTYDPATNASLAKHEIFKGVTSNNGATWTWTAITKNSTMDNMRPIVPAWDAAHTALLWFRGSYTSAQSINAAVVGLITETMLPVELTAFSASVSLKNVELTWTTATEVNNHGFDVERRTRGSGSVAGVFEKIGFVSGSGNSNVPRKYCFTDMNARPGKYSYRLKQIDNDGRFEHSHEIEAELALPSGFALAQNYPNPFNPSTKIDFIVGETNETTVKVYSLLGQEVATVFRGTADAGTLYTVEFNASAHANGIYFYVLRSGGDVEAKKLIIAK